MKYEIETQHSRIKYNPQIAKIKRKNLRRKRKIFIETASGKITEKEGMHSKDPLNLVSKFIAAVVATYPIADSVYNHVYSRLCEEFYGIPACYFSKSIDTSVLYIALMCIFLGIAILGNWAAEKASNIIWKTVWRWLITASYGIGLGVINTKNLLRLCTVSGVALWEKFYLLFVNNTFVVVLVVMIISIFTISGISRICVERTSKSKTKLVVYYILTIPCIFISACIMFEGTKSALNPNPSQKTEYEIATYSNLQYAVLSEYENKILVVPASKNEHDVLQLNTANYYFLDRSECQFSYYNFDQIPKIIGDDQSN